MGTVTWFGLPRHVAELAGSANLLLLSSRGFRVQRLLFLDMLLESLGESDPKFGLAGTPVAQVSFLQTTLEPSSL